MNVYPLFLAALIKAMRVVSVTLSRLTHVVVSLHVSFDVKVVRDYAIHFNTV